MTPDAHTRHESSFKAALCLDELGHAAQGRKEAERFVDSLAAEDGLKPIVLFWLWREYTQAVDLGVDEQISASNRLMQAIDREFTLQETPGDASQREIRDLIPRSTVAEIADWNIRLTANPANLVVTPQLQEFVLKAGEILGDPPLLQVNRELTLCESLWMAADPKLDSHLENALGVLRTYSLQAPEPVALGDLWTSSERLPRAIERNSWRSRISAQRPITELASEMQQWLDMMAAQKIPAGSLLFLEMSRLHYANHDLAAAERVLQELLKDGFHRVDFGFGYYAEALLMLGLLLEERGDAEGAQAAWDRADYQRWQQLAVGHSLRERSEWQEEFFGRLYGFCAVVLRGKATPEQFRELRQAFFVSLRKSYPAAAVSLLQILVETRLSLKKWEGYGSELAKSAKMREFIRDWLWKKKGFGPIIEGPARFCVQEILRSELEVRELTSEEQEMIEAFVKSGIELTLAGKLRPWQSRNDIAGLADVWDSADSILGDILGKPEKRLADCLQGLPAELHPPLTYIFARRFLASGKEASGQAMLQLTRQTVEGPERAADDSLLTQRVRRLLESQKP